MISLHNKKFVGFKQDFSDDLLPQIRIRFIAFLQPSVYYSYKEFAFVICTKTIKMDDKLVAEDNNIVVH